MSEQTTPLRICMVSDDFLPGQTGVGSHLQSVVAALAARGHAVSVLTTRRRGQPKIERWRGATVHRSLSLAIKGYYQSLAGKREIRGVIAEHSPSIVHCHYLSTLLVNAVTVAGERGLKRVLTYHMPLDVITAVPFMRPIKPLIERIHTKYINQFDTIIAPSRGMVAALRDQNVNVAIEHLSNPIRPADPDTREVDRANHSFVVMFAGRLAPEKNIDLLLRAFVDVQSRVPDSCLWIAGEGELRAGLERLADKLGIANSTRFLGPLSHADLASHYVSCDVFVLPSVMETQGLVLMEAMSHAKPVIATTRIVSGPELIDDGVNGFLVDPENPEPLAARLLSLANDRELMARLGNAGRTRAEDFSEDRIISGLEDIYRRTLDSD